MTPTLYVKLLGRPTWITSKFVLALDQRVRT